MLQQRISLKRDLIELRHCRENCQLQLSQLAIVDQREKTRLLEILENQKNFDKKQEKHLREIDSLKNELMELQLQNEDKNNNLQWIRKELNYLDEKQRHLD